MHERVYCDHYVVVYHRDCKKSFQQKTLYPQIAIETEFLHSQIARNAVDRFFII